MGSVVPAILTGRSRAALLELILIVSLLVVPFAKTVSADSANAKHVQRLSVGLHQVGGMGRRTSRIRAMKLKASTKGAILATAVAFVASPTRAENSNSSPQPTLIACLGVNSCKGQSACKSFDHDCQAMNTCKGKASF